MTQTGRSINTPIFRYCPRKCEYTLDESFIERVERSLEHELSQHNQHEIPRLLANVDIAYKAVAKNRLPRGRARRRS